CARGLHYYGSGYVDYW
nr:immunoglobulin heavy chain junction region [Mus musculus]MBK4185921.1 immunoglobulin heavy chain junction region [Mus musculus]